MTATVLVATTVHHPDDTRIRERLIRSLSTRCDVLYAARAPGPTDREGFDFLELRGGRLARIVRATTVLISGRWQVAAIHDPELIPSAVLASWVRGRPVVFDMHEDLPSQIVSKSWIPGWAKPGARLAARWLYWMAKQFLSVTVAESSYLEIFDVEGPVFPNYPARTNWPFAVPEGNGSAVYVGDVREERGILVAVEAAGRSGMPLVVVGPVDDETRKDLENAARRSGTSIEITGRLPNHEAMELAASCSVGLSPLLDLPNYRHSLPTKTIEYLALGLPVVASDLRATRESIGHFETVRLVPPGDPQSLAEAMVEMGQPEIKLQAVDACKDVRRRYRWPDEEVVEFYATLINQG